MPWNILSARGVGYLPNQIYHQCVLQYWPLEMNGIFPKCHLIVDGEDFENWCFMPNSDVTVEEFIFEFLSFACY